MLGRSWRRIAQGPAHACNILKRLGDARMAHVQLGTANNLQAVNAARCITLGDKGCLAMDERAEPRFNVWVVVKISAKK